MNSATGIYLDGQVARGRPVSFIFTAGELQLTGENLALNVELARVRVSDRLGDIPRFLYLPDGAVVETPDNDAVDAALAARRRGRGARLIHALESRQRLAVAACVLLVIAIVSLGFYGPPVLARIVAKRVPFDVDQRIGAAALLTIDPYFEVSTLGPTERQRVHAQLARLRPDAAATLPRVEFRSMNGGLPNAFALPGNLIIITDELLYLPASDDEIAAVLAHELGHLEKRHGLQSLLRQSFALLIVAAVTGDLSALTSFAGTIPLTILTAGYSRDLEREADHYALELLRTRNINPRAFATALAKLDAAYEDLQRNSTYVSTHPTSDERIQLFGGLSPDERSAVLAEAWYDRAAAAVQQHRHDQAIEFYDRVIELAPTARAYTLRAESHYRCKQHEAAEADLLQALQLDPQHARAHAVRAEVLTLGLKNYPDAIKAAKQALQANPNDAHTLATLGLAELMAGEAAAAVVDLDRAIALDPSNPQGWAYRGYLRRNMYPAGALADYDTALKLDPRPEWIYHSRAVIRSQQKDFKGALADFSAVKDPSQHTGEFYFERGVVQHNLGKIDLAIADYDRALQKSVEASQLPTLRINRAAALESRRNYRAAIVDLDAALELDPKNGRAYLSRAMNRRRAGEPAAALGDLEKAIQAGVEEKIIRRERGYVQWDLEQHQEALRELDRALDLGGPDAGAYRARALVHFSLGDWSRAEADLNTVMIVARRRSGEYAEFFRLLARRRAKIDDQQAAFSAVVAKWPPSWAKSIGRYLTGDLSEIQLLAEANVDLTPSAIERRCEAYFYIAQTHLIAGDAVSARDYFEKCVGTGVFNYFEYKLARAELHRLRVRE